MLWFTIDCADIVAADKNIREESFCDRGCPSGFRLREEEKREGYMYLCVCIKNLWKCWWVFFFSSFWIVSVLFSCWTINFWSFQGFFFIIVGVLSQLYVFVFLERFLIWFIGTFWINGFFSFSFFLFVKFLWIFKNKTSLDHLQFRRNFCIFWLI